MRKLVTRAKAASSFFPARAISGKSKDLEANMVVFSYVCDTHFGGPCFCRCLLIMASMSSTLSADQGSTECLRQRCAPMDHAALAILRQTAKALWLRLTMVARTAPMMVRASCLLTGCPYIMPSLLLSAARLYKHYPMSTDSVFTH